MNAQAEEEYETALQVNPYDELAWRELGGVRNANGDFKTAEEDYRKALEPNDSEAKSGLAIVLITTSRTAGAMPSLEDARQ